MLGGGKRVKTVHLFSVEHGFSVQNEEIVADKLLFWDKTTGGGASPGVAERPRSAQGWQSGSSRVTSCHDGWHTPGHAA